MKIAQQKARRWSVRPLVGHRRNTTVCGPKQVLSLFSDCSGNSKTQISEAQDSRSPVIWAVVTSLGQHMSRLRDTSLCLYASCFSRYTKPKVSRFRVRRPPERRIIRAKQAFSLQTWSYRIECRTEKKQEGTVCCTCSSIQTWSSFRPNTRQISTSPVDQRSAETCASPSRRKSRVEPNP